LEDWRIWNDSRERGRVDNGVFGFAWSKQEFLKLFCGEHFDEQWMKSQQDGVNKDRWRVESALFGEE
jgi:hypothetical protein